MPAVLSLTCLMMLGPPSASAAQQCAEVESAKGLRTNGPQAGALSQDVQSPRSQDTQSPRGQQPAQRQQATQLVNEAAAACDAGNPTVASQKGPRGDGPTSPIDGAEVPWC